MENKFPGIKTIALDLVGAGWLDYREIGSHQYLAFYDINQFIFTSFKDNEEQKLIWTKQYSNTWNQL